MNTNASTVDQAADILFRKVATSNDPNIFTAIYDEDVNIAIWQRDNSNDLNIAINDFIKQHPNTEAVLAVSPTTTQEVMSKNFGESPTTKILADDIALIVDMFCCLFDLKRAGLRLTVLERAMCPRFHVDRIPCRLVTTYQGIATQWLSNNVIDRTKLGTGNQGKSDEESGLLKQLSDINQMTQGDVALLKGENWDESSGGGLVHRSPAILPGEKRLLLTLDFIDD